MFYSLGLIKLLSFLSNLGVKHLYFLYVKIKVGNRSKLNSEHIDRYTDNEWNQLLRVATCERSEQNFFLINYLKTPCPGSVGKDLDAVNFLTVKCINL